jgi:DNA-directed RNA polymerase subunit M/transcription elongation factor TFIIS
VVKTRFCPECENILIPRKGKLYCKACDKEFDLNSDEQNEYKIIKKIKHDDKETAPIVIKEALKSGKISGEDRKAFEEFFTGGEESGY